MALQSTDVLKRHLARGIDSYSARSAILDGFAEDLLNFDLSSSGQLHKRKGYEGYLGWVPLRVKSIAHSGTAIRLTFDDSQSIDLAEVGIGPLVVQGKLPSDDAPGGGYAGDFSTTNQVHYYTDYTISNRETLTAYSSTLTKTESQHGISSPYIFTGLATSDDALLVDHTIIGPNNTAINTTTNQITIRYSVAASGDGFFYYADKSAEAGVTYIHNVAAPSTSETISAVTHNLTNFNIGVRCYDDTIAAGSLTEVGPSLITIDGSGNVVVTFGSAFQGDIILTAAPLANVTTTTLATPGVNNITVSVDDNFNFFYVYALNGATSKLESVGISNISYDSVAGEATIEYLLGGAAEYVEVYHEPANIVGNIIQLTDTGAVSETYTSNSPQLTVWGISHEGIYRDADSRGGHVTHIDNYKSASEERLICGLGGNFYGSSPYSTANAASYLYGSGNVHLRERIEGDTTIAPLFDVTGSVVARTRGLITDASIESYTARISTATYISSEVIDYTIVFTNKSASVVWNTHISAFDKLTVTNMAKAENNGTFDILSITSDSSTALVLRVSNSSALNSNVNETAAQGRAGVFTDKLTLENQSTFITGDVFLSTAISSSYSLSITAVDNANIYVDGVTASIAFPDGVRVFGRRTCYIIPLRDDDGVASVANIVRGDMLDTSFLDYKLRVVNVITNSNNSLTLVGDGTTVTATSNTAHGLYTGQRIAILYSSIFNCSAVVTDVTDSTTFTFAHTAVGSSTGTLLGKCIEVDDSVTFQDGGSSDSLTVAGRWTPIEAPTNSGTLTVPTYVYHQDVEDYDSHSIVRSTMASDNLYTVNYQDEVMKIDGSNLYCAGLPRWQPQLFVQFDTSVTSLLKGYAINYTAVSTTGKYFTLPIAAFKVGDRIHDSGTGAIFTVSGVDLIPGSPETYHIIVAENTASISGANTLTLVKTYYYYARLNYIDANNNSIASAATGHQDCIVEQTADGQFRHKLIGMPVFNNYDYDRIELELYRTKANPDRNYPVFYLAHRKVISFNEYTGYIEINDYKSDDELVDLDATHSVLVGKELGTGWTLPPRAKYITSAGSRLITANIKSYPEFDIVLTQPSTNTVTAANLAGLTMLFRKDSTDAGTTTNMNDRIKFEFVNSGAVTITPANITTTASTFTIFSATTPAVGSWVYLYHNAAGSDNDLYFAGWYQVYSIDSGVSFTCNASHGLGTAGGTAADVDRFVSASTPSNVPVWIGTDGNYNQKDGNTSGSIEYIAMLRLSNAINAVSRNADVAISGQETFTPWLLAGSGNDYALGQINIQCPIALATTPEVALGTVGTTYSLFVNNIARVTNEQISSNTYLFPSRVAISYENYPEIFDNILSDKSNSDSTVDINTSDGQEITGLIPFFGESTFSGSTLNQVVVVFKTNSIYVLDPITRDYQKIDSRGLGCTAPHSIAATKNGIIFANNSGIYRLNRDMSVSFVGKYMKGLWDESINSSALAEAQGHQYGQANQYKLSIPTGASTYNNEVYVYNHELEGQGQEYGGWSRYDNHPATGWANQADNAYMASTGGDVFEIKIAENAYSYRDDAASINSQAILKAEDFDLPAVRKVVGKIGLSLEYETCALLSVHTAVNLIQSFDLANSITSSSAEDITLNISPVKRKCNYMQIKLTHNVIDERIAISGISYNVARLDTRGTTQGADR